MSAAPTINAMPPLPLSVWLRRPRKELPFPLGDPRCRLFSLARRGLFAGVEALGFKPGDEILVPAYHHGSEIEPLLKAGLACRFYDVGEESFESDEEDLDALLGPRVKALYLTHYLGFPQDAARWRKWCDERGLMLIEDAAQAWLGSRDGAPVGSHGDLSIFCLYKTFGLADGAAALCVSPPKPPGERGSGIKTTARRHVSYLMQRSPALAEARRKTAGAPLPFDPKLDFAMGENLAPCAATNFLLPRIADGEAQEKRAANHAFLFERLERLVPGRFSRLPEGASPFAFPISVGDKQTTLDRLARRGIIAFNFWLVPHTALAAQDFPRAAALRKSVIGLPVHQELGAKELERISGAVFESLRAD